jgi:hypothetical protein
MNSSKSILPTTAETTAAIMVPLPEDFVGAVVADGVADCVAILD